MGEDNCSESDVRAKWYKSRSTLIWDSGRFQLPSVWENLFIMKYKSPGPMTDTS